MLTERKKNILRLIVGDYIKKAAPIASESIVREHGLRVSPATIRNDVAELEQDKYITRPHPSAGSIPLDKGYRFYVESMEVMQVNHIEPSIGASVRKNMLEVQRDVGEWASVAAIVLARLVGNLAIATFPKVRESRVKHIDLVSLQDFFALLIVVFQQARLRRQLIRLQEPADSVELQMSANRLSKMLAGHTWREIESKEMALSPLEEQLVAMTVVMLRDEDSAKYPDHYIDGLRNLLAQPEFTRSEKTRAVVEGIEDGSLAQAVLDEAPNAGVIRIVIGQENRGDMLRPLSVVIGQYGIPGEAIGAVGAVGPVRMEYEKTVAGVELVTGLMSELAESVRTR